MVSSGDIPSSPSSSPYQGGIYIYILQGPHVQCSLGVLRAIIIRRLPIGQGIAQYVCRLRQSERSIKLISDDVTGTNGHTYRQREDVQCYSTCMYILPCFGVCHSYWLPSFFFFFVPVTETLILSSLYFLDNEILKVLLLYMYIYRKTFLVMN